MKRRIVFVVFPILFLAGTGSAQTLLNGGFEQHFGERITRDEWGDFGETWGACRQVLTNDDNTSAVPRSGIGLVVLDVQSGAWSGVWQQVPVKPNQPFGLTGFCRLTGELPADCQTMLKVEYYDGLDNPLGEAVSSPGYQQPAGAWAQQRLTGITPSEAASMRIVILAGGGTNTFENRIFWDDVELHP